MRIPAPGAPSIMPCGRIGRTPKKNKNKIEIKRRIQTLEDTVHDIAADGRTSTKNGRVSKLLAKLLALYNMSEHQCVEFRRRAYARAGGERGVFFFFFFF